jgi:thioesterase III
MKSETEIKVRGYHLDFYGHVNNARYLEFLEEGRWQFLEDHVDLAEWRQRGWSFLVVNININYRHPATMGDILVIETALSRIGKHSAVIHQHITMKGRPIDVVDADITFVIGEGDKALRLEGPIRVKLERLMNQP